MGALCALASSPASSSAATNSFNIILFSCPYTFTDSTYQDVDWRNPYVRYNLDTDHSSGIRYIHTTGEAVSDYADIAAHDQNYHQPPNGYIPSGWHFWLRAYSKYGTCIAPNQSSYAQLNVTGYLRA
jgi:hypothetical protein